MISKLTYFRLTTLFPLIVPIILLIVQFGILAPLGIVLPQRIDNAIDVLWSAAFLFGLPYLVMIGIVLWLLRGRSLRVHVLVAAATPLLLVAVVGLMFLLMHGGGDSGPLELTLFYARYCLMVGYGYVVLALGSLWLLHRLGRLQ